MAQNQAPAFVMVALLLLAAATPLAHGQAVNAVTVRGGICCTSSGNCPAGATGVSGVPVLLNCTTALGSGTVMVGRGVTGVDGSFNISISNVLSLALSTIPAVVGGNLPCSVIVNLPLNQTVCPVLNTATGVLAGIPNLVNTVLSPVLGLVLNTAVSGFIRLNI